MYTSDRPQSSPEASNTGRAPSASARARSAAADDPSIDELVGRVIHPQAELTRLVACTGRALGRVEKAGEDALGALARLEPRPAQVDLQPCVAGAVGEHSRRRGRGG